MPPLRSRIVPLLVATAALAGSTACWGNRGAAAFDQAARAAAATSSCRASAQGQQAAGVSNEAPRIGEEIARAEICAMMDRGAQAWNRGDLEAFMDDYVDSATYVGGRGVLRGRTQIATNYAARFAPGAVRDSLSFRDLEVRLVSEELAQVVARWVLSRGDSVASSGWTSLLMRRGEQRWRIVHDHSS